MSRKQDAELARQKKLQKQRRSFLIKSIGLAAAVALGIGSWYYTKTPSFEQASAKPELRQKWLNSLETRPYVTMRVTSNDDLRELKERIGYVPDKGMSADTVPNDEKNATKGTHSKLYVHPASFSSPFPTKSWGIILENIIEKHELIHADHFHHGIPGYEQKWFENAQGELQKPLFSAVSEIVAHRSEWENLAPFSGDRYIDAYRDELKKVAFPYFLRVIMMKPNTNLINRIEREAWFTPPKITVLQQNR